MSTKLNTREIRVDEFKSSTIEKTAYDFTNQELKVKFSSNNIYSYKGVDSDTYLKMIYSNSIGRSFNELIKDQFVCEKSKDSVFIP